MDASLIWTVVGSAAGILATGLAAWQVRLELTEHVTLSARAWPRWRGLPVAVPAGRLPREVRGRDALVAELQRRVSRKPHRSGGGTLVRKGGIGKSTVALAVARVARARGWRVWWVPAADAATLAGMPPDSPAAAPSQSMPEDVMSHSTLKFHCARVRHDEPGASELSFRVAADAGITASSVCSLAGPGDACLAWFHSC
jgi:hypothetical protein